MPFLIIQNKIPYFQNLPSKAKNNPESHDFFPILHYNANMGFFWYSEQ